MPKTKRPKLWYEAHVLSDMEDEKSTGLVINDPCKTKGEALRKGMHWLNHYLWAVRVDVYFGPDDGYYLDRKPQDEKATNENLLAILYKRPLVAPRQIEEAEAQPCCQTCSAEVAMPKKKVKPPGLVCVKSHDEDFCSVCARITIDLTETARGKFCDRCMMSCWVCFEDAVVSQLPQSEGDTWMTLCMDCFTYNRYPPEYSGEIITDEDIPF